MTPKHIYDYAVDRALAKRAANFLEPYLRDLVGDFDPKMTGIDAEFSYSDAGEGKPKKLSHLRINVRLQCVPNEPFAAVLEKLANDQSIKMLDDEGEVIATCVPTHLSLGVDCLVSYTIALDFFGKGIPAVLRGFQRIYQTARKDVE